MLFTSYLRPIAATLLLAGLSVPTVAAAQKVEVKERLEDLQLVARRDSNDAAAQYNVAMGYMSKKRWAEAEQSLRHALTIEPRFAEAHLALYVAHLQNEDYWKGVRRQKGDSAMEAAIEQANRMFTRAVLIDPFLDVRIMATLWRVWGTSRWAKGFDAFLEGRYEKAAEEFDIYIADVTRDEPRDSVDTGVLWMHALATARLQRYALAQEDVEALLRVTSVEVSTDSISDVPLKHNEYRYMLAAIKDRAGQPEQAIKLYQEVLENDVSNYMAHVQLARIHEARRDWPRAIAERRRAVETNPDDASLLTELGVTLGKSGNFTEAAEVLQQAESQNPRDVRPLFWRGLALVQLGQQGEAKSAFQRFVAVAPPRYSQQVQSAKAQLEKLP